MGQRKVISKESVEALTMLAYKLAKDELCNELLGLMRSHFAKGQKYEVEHRESKDKARPLRLLGAGEVPGPGTGELS
ncbi:MAG: hypothetical protein KF681_08570 [Bdellovibrionaceae bacterium]|nr:hypothetical protein [Pseudobdellovibrionaceae bacterium]